MAEERQGSLTFDAFCSLPENCFLLYNRGENLPTTTGSRCPIKSTWSVRPLSLLNIGARCVAVFFAYAFVATSDEPHGDQFNRRKNAKLLSCRIASAKGAVILFSMFQSFVRQIITLLSSDCDATNFPIGSQATPFTRPAEDSDPVVGGYRGAAWLLRVGSTHRCGLPASRGPSQCALTIRLLCCPPTRSKSGLNQNSTQHPLCHPGELLRAFYISSSQHPPLANRRLRLCPHQQVSHTSGLHYHHHQRQENAHLERTSRN
mmetsp:Transcript_30739/g.117683  ORF Transcript_30739/g.117683 Transcript_30739/m.117683 type:complete len:261 (-) Transcript_30739:1019-1801(-)